MSVLADLLAKRDAAKGDFDYVAAVYRAAAEAGEIPADHEAAYTEARAAVEALDARIIELDGQERREAQVAEARKRIQVAVGDGVVHSEPRTYGPEQPERSYFADLCRAALPGTPGYSGAVERLTAHGRETVRDAVNDPAKRSRVVRSVMEENRQNPNEARRIVADLESRSLEVRAGMNTGSTSGGSFATPVYYVPDYAPWREYGRVFADAAHHEDLPAYGMTVYLPHLTAGAAVAAQSTVQNTTITESDPTAAYLSAGLTTEAGQVTVSQQLLDRAGPGIEFDRIVFDQLQRDYAQTFDTAVLTAALANAGTVSDTKTSTASTSIIQDLYSDVANAIQAMETTEGTVLAPTHIFTTATEWGYVESLLDSNGRPLVVPNYAGPFNALAASLSGKENVVTEGDTGFALLSVPVFKDNNIPTSSSNTQILVCHMPEIWVWEGELVPRTIPQTYAQNLSVLLQVYSYNAVIPRYAEAVQAISGARYPASPTFIQV
jgi:HK97 family phage major capsid protein